MNEFVLFVRSTALSEWVRTAPWTWPALEIVHFVGMCLLLGVIGLLDVRLLGFLRSIEVSSLRKLLPFGLLGFLFSLISGVLFFVGAPDQYVRNPAFFAKVVFLLLAGLNAAYFETHSGERAIVTGHIEEAPTSFKVAGAISLFSWLMVLYWGRMLPFIGNAF